MISKAGFFTLAFLVFSNDWVVGQQELSLSPPVIISTTSLDEANFVITQLIGQPDERGEGGKLEAALEKLNSLNADDSSDFGKKSIEAAIVNKRYDFISSEKKKYLADLEKIRNAFNSLTALTSPCENHFVEANYHGRLVNAEKTFDEASIKIAVGDSSASVKDTDWGKAVKEISKLFKQYEEFRDNSDHPFRNVADNRYHDVVRDHMSQLEAFENQLKSIAIPVKNEFVQAKNTIVDRLYSSAQSAGTFEKRQCAVRNLLRIALYQNSELASSKFVEFAKQEMIQGPNYAFVISIKEAAFLALKPGEEQNPDAVDIEQYVGVAKIIRQIISTRQEVEIRDTLVKHFYCDLILNGFNELRKDNDKKDEQSGIFATLDSELDGIGSLVGNTDEIRLAKQDLFKIFHFGAFKRQDPESDG